MTYDKKRQPDRRVEISLDRLVDNDRRKGDRRASNDTTVITPEHGVKAVIGLLDEKGLITRDEVLQRIRELKWKEE